MILQHCRTVSLRIAYMFIIGCRATGSSNVTDLTPPTVSPTPSDTLQALVTSGKVVGLSAALINGTYPSGVQYFAFGTKIRGLDIPPDANTEFEIGSLTKLYTALILADMGQKNEVKLDSPVQSAYPSAAFPSCQGRQVTFTDLATHTSGFPAGMPPGFAPPDWNNPYAALTTDYLFKFATNWATLFTAPPCEMPGSVYRYSNIGYALLGQILAAKSGQSYESLVASRITGPLGVTDTVISLNADQRSRLATGYDAIGTATPLWDQPATAAAGAIKSTVHDMAAFLAANMGLAASPLTAAMLDTQTPRRLAGSGEEIGLAWTHRLGALDILWKNGATGGYSSYMAFNAANKVGIVILTNTTFDQAQSVDQAGKSILKSLLPAP